MHHYDNAPKFTGTPGQNKLVYFGPDEDALFGRYWDGHPISEHPSNDEISTYWEFWVALANKEQKEVCQGMFDMGIADQFRLALKDKDDVTIVEQALKWWDKHYPHESSEFFAYVRQKKATLYDASGWDRSRAHKFQGAIPQRVKQLVMVAKPELLKSDGVHESPFQKIFYSICTKALVGGN